MGGVDDLHETAEADGAPRCCPARAGAARAVPPSPQLSTTMASRSSAGRDRVRSASSSAGSCRQHRQPPRSTGVPPTWPATRPASTFTSRSC
ncbi:hypothetical protein QJS66_05860 [Kocuria rhizophila]|nr:hypothetical protein QJS66_05860 [Kocuria rhizophila]